MAPLAKRFRVGAELPAPVGVCVRGALHTAVRRWPVASRDELAAEWAGELYEIEHDTTSTTVQRAWRALAYTVSLACARTQQEHLREGHSMGTNRKPIIGLIGMSFVMAAFTTLVVVVGTIAEEGLFDPEAGVPAAPVTYDWAPWLAVVCGMVGGWFAGRWLVRRAPLRAASPGSVVGLSICGVLLGTAIILGLGFTTGFGHLLLYIVLPIAVIPMVVFLGGYVFAHPDIRSRAGTPPRPDAPSSASA
ncbi:MAG: hypothetical protein ACRDUA_00895 [Micromonosporaceae bacterium]